MFLIFNTKWTKTERKNVILTFFKLQLQLHCWRAETEIKLEKWIRNTPNFVLLFLKFLLKYRNIEIKNIFIEFNA